MRLRGVLVVLAGILSVRAACASLPVYVVDATQADFKTRVALACLQGIVNRNPCDGALHLLRYPNDERWLRSYAQPGPGGWQMLTAHELLAALAGKGSGPAAQLAGSAKGQVLYDPAKPYTLAIATTMAGVLDGIATPLDLGMRTLMDCRTRWPDKVSAYRWAVREFMPRCNKERLAVVGDWGECIRDMVVGSRIFCTDLDVRQERELEILQDIFSRFSPGALVLCHPRIANDRKWQSEIVGASHIPVPCSDAANFTVHAAAPPVLPTRQPMPFVERRSGVLLTFLYVGGEDMAFALGRLRTLWDSPARGTAPIGWTISGALLEFAPSIFSYYSARTLRVGADELVLAPNGFGYGPPSALQGRNDVWAKITNGTENCGIRTVALSDPGDPAAVGPAVARLAKAVSAAGVLLTGESTLASGTYEGVRAIAQSYQLTDLDMALADIRALKKGRQPLCVTVDPYAITPADIAWLAARLSGDFQVVGPAEFLHHAALDERKAAPGQRRRATFSVDEFTLGETRPGPYDKVPVTARVKARLGIDSVSAVYSCPPGDASGEEALSKNADESWSGWVPACPFAASVRATILIRDQQGQTYLSDPSQYEIEQTDKDSDGLSDAAEALLGTGGANIDTDGDGLRDGNDPHPLQPEQNEMFYLTAVAAADDGFLLNQDRGSRLTDEGARQVEGDALFIYRLPLRSVPQGAQASVYLLASGDLTAAASRDGENWREALRCSSAQPASRSWRIPDEWLAGQARELFLRCSAAPGQAGRVHSVSIAPPDDAPGVIPLPAPAAPVAAQPVAVGATVFDHAGIARAAVTYKTERREAQTLALSEVGDSQKFAANLPEFADGDVVTYWITAENGKGVRTLSPPMSFPVGITRSEVVSVLPGQEFEGTWRVGDAWNGTARWASEAGKTDAAALSLNGGNYFVWLLAAPRGRAVQVRMAKLNMEVPAAAPEGWQSLGSVYLQKGDSTVQITSSQSLPASPKASCAYAQLILARDPFFRPPESLVDFVNTMNLVEPSAGRRVWGPVDVLVTAAGNVKRIEFFVDDELVCATARSPLKCAWNTRGWEEGRHFLTLIGRDHSGEPLLHMTVPITVARQ
jgi:hypothetical protein